MQDTSDFLDALFGAKPSDWHALLWTLEGKRSHWFTDLAPMARFASNLAGNVYVGMAISRTARKNEAGLYVRGKAEEVDGIVGVYGDFDFGTVGHKKSDHPPTPESALEIIARFPLSPTLVTNSGHGLQAFWLFKEPWTFDSDEERQAALVLMARWSATWKTLYAAAGHSLDSVFDLARVMRLPGTMNTKPDCAPVLATILSKGGPRCNPSEFDNYLLEAPPHSVRPTAEPVEGLTLNADATPPFAKHHLLSAGDPKYRAAIARQVKAGGDKSPSGWDWTLTRMCAIAGWSDQEIADTLIWSRSQNGEDLKLRDNYYGLTIANVRGGIDPAEFEALNIGGGEDVEDGKRKFLKRKLLIDIAEIQRYKAANEEFRLLLHGRKEPIDLGAVQGILDLDTFRRAVYRAMSFSIPNYKKSEWLPITDAIGKLIVDVEVPDSISTSGQIRERLEIYLSERPVVELSKNEDKAKAAIEDAEIIANRLAFNAYGGTCIFLSHFVEHLRVRYNERAEESSVGILLRKNGYESKIHACTLNGKRTSRSVWIIREIVETASEEASVSP